MICRQSDLGPIGSATRVVSRSLLLRPLVIACLTGLLAAPSALATTLSVGAAGSGADFTVIQDALDAAQPGDTVLVHAKPGPYFEQLRFPRSGSEAGGYITLRAAPGETPVLDGTGLRRDQHMIRILSKSWVRVVGLEIQNNVDGFGVRVSGAGTHIELRNLHIHHMRGKEAGGISVYGTKPEPLSQIVVDGSYLHDNEPAHSETLVLNGNVSDFQVTDNLLVDNDNIGIDFIGGETDVNKDTSLVARNGVCRGNVVIRSNSSYGGGYAAGIYVDGGRDIVIENNRVTGSDYGIEVAAENRGLLTSGISVRNNVIHENEKAGIVFGGYNARVGRASNNTFTGNVLYHNNTLGRKGKGRYFEGNGVGELYIQFGQGNLVRDNLIVAGPENVFIEYDEKAGDENQIDYNLYWSEDVSTGKFSLGKKTYKGFTSWLLESGKDAHSVAQDPLLADPDGGDFHLEDGSPAIDAGDPAFVPDGERDLDGRGRLAGVAVDLGADEAGPTCPDDEGTGAFCSRDAGSVAPGKLLIYYGYPSLINGAGGDLDAAAAELAQYDFVVLGSGLERPAAEGGSDDHEETVAIVAKPILDDTRVFGYVPLGVLTSNLSPAQIEDRIDRWMNDVGVDGIFFDEFGYDFCVTRARQNAAVDYVKLHHPGTPVVANAFQPDDALGTSANADFPNPACGGSFVANPDATPTRLDASDYFLMESHQVIEGQFVNETDWQFRAEALRRFQESMGIQVLSVTTAADDTAYDESKFFYAWYSAALYGHAATGWGEYGFGAIPSEAPFRAPPALDLGHERIGPILVEGSTYEVATDQGVLSVGAEAHTYGFTAFDPPQVRTCDPACVGFTGKLKLKVKPVVGANAVVDFFADLDGDVWTGLLDQVALSGDARFVGSTGRKLALTLDANSSAALLQWLDELAGPSVSVDPRGEVKIRVKLDANGTQSKLSLAMPVRATSAQKGTKKGNARLKQKGSARTAD